MKKTILILLMLISQISNSQKLEFDNFIFDNGKVKWQKVYNSKLEKNDIIQFYQKSGIIREFNYSENLITGLIEKTGIDYKQYEKSFSSPEPYITNSFLSCFITIEFKQNRYRLTLTDLKLIQKYENDSRKLGQIGELKDYVIKSNDSDYTRLFKKISSKIFNNTFDKLFEIKISDTDEW